MNLPEVGTLVEGFVVAAKRPEDIQDCKTFWQRRDIIRGYDLSGLARRFAFMSPSEPMNDSWKCQ